MHPPHDSQDEPTGAALRWPSFTEVLRLRCPVCWRGAMFRRPWSMHVSCEACSHHFDRGHGYFLGAMFFSYTIVVLIETMLIALMRLCGLDWSMCLVTAVLSVIGLGPLFAFPVSRWAWVTIERRFLHDGQEKDGALRAELLRRRQQRDGHE